jgi:hypothetical protein
MACDEQAHIVFMSVPSLVAGNKRYFIAGSSPAKILRRIFHIRLLTSMLEVFLTSAL